MTCAAFRFDRDHRGLRRRQKTAGGATPHLQGRSAAEDGGQGFLASRGMAAGQGKKVEDRHCSDDPLAVPTAL